MSINIVSGRGRVAPAYSQTINQYQSNKQTSNHQSQMQMFQEAVNQPARRTALVLEMT